MLLNQKHHVTCTMRTLSQKFINAYDYCYVMSRASYGTKETPLKERQIKSL